MGLEAHRSPSKRSPSPRKRQKWRHRVPCRSHPQSDLFHASIAAPSPNYDRGTVRCWSPTKCASDRPARPSARSAVSPGIRRHIFSIAQLLQRTFPSWTCGKIRLTLWTFFPLFPLSLLSGFRALFLLLLLSLLLLRNLLLGRLLSLLLLLLPLMGSPRPLLLTFLYVSSTLLGPLLVPLPLLRRQKEFSR